MPFQITCSNCEQNFAADEEKPAKADCPFCLTELLNPSTFEVSEEEMDPEEEQVDETDNEELQFSPSSVDASGHYHSPSGSHGKDAAVWQKRLYAALAIIAVVLVGGGALYWFVFRE